MIPRRLFFLLPNPETARQVAVELREAGVRSKHLHAMTAYGSAALPEIPPATLLQTSQLAHGVGLGLLVGGLAGLVGGWLAITHSPPTLVLGTWVLWLCGGAGAAGGAMLGGILGQDRLDPEILPYEGSVLNGAVLLLVDVPQHKVETVTKILQQHLPADEM